MAGTNGIGSFASCVSIKGTSNVKFEEAVTSAQQDAQSALNQDQVPRAYQNAVRDYFDDLKK